MDFLFEFYNNYLLSYHILFLYYFLLPLAFNSKTKLYKTISSFIISNFFSFCITSLLTILSLYFINMFYLFFILFLFLSFIAIILEIYCLKNFNASINDNILGIIQETNTNEIKEFIHSFLDIKVLSFSIIFILIPPMFLYLNPNILFIFISIVSLYYIFQKNKLFQDFYIIKLINLIVTHFKKETRYKSFKKTKVDQEYFEEDTITIIIGESLTRNRMSLYGYPRNTSKNLRKLQNESSRLFVFDNVISTNSYTRLVLPKIVSFFNSNSKKEWSEYENIIQIYKKLGYKTSWISNQESTGIFGGTISSYISQFCDFFFFNREGNLNINKNEKYDIDLLDKINNVLQEDAKKKLIIIHLMGNHFTYNKRYPSEFNIFKNDNFIKEKKKKYNFFSEKTISIYNEYDNSVLYNDYIVSSIFNLVDKQSRNHLCFYLSDHGEEVYEEKEYMGHNQEVASRFMFEIPYMIFLSKSYKDKYKDKLFQINKSVHNSFISDDLIHNLLYLTSVKHPKYNDKYSLVNSQDHNYERNILGINYDKELKEKNNSLKLNKKIWIHRVNNIDKLFSSQKQAHGIELDIYYEENKFIIKHKQSDSSNITLKNYLSYVDKSVAIWIDLKNLSETNYEEIDLLLTSLISKNNLDIRKIIIESSNYKILSKLKDSFYVSYYLPYLNKEDMNGKKFTEIIRNIKTSNLNAISFPGYMLNFLEKNIDFDIDFLTWFEELNYFTNINDYDYINKLVTNPRIKAILISDKNTSNYKINLNFSKKINSYMSEIKRINDSNKRVVIYGSGTWAELIFPLLENIVGVIDKSTNKHGQMFFDKTILDINNINKLNAELIIISVLGRENEIIEDLSNKNDLKNISLKVFGIE